MSVLLVVMMIWALGSTDYLVRSFVFEWSTVNCLLIGSDKNRQSCIDYCKNNLWQTDRQVLFYLACVKFCLNRNMFCLYNGFGPLTLKTIFNYSKLQLNFFLFVGSMVNWIVGRKMMQWNCCLQIDNRSLLYIGVFFYFHYRSNTSLQYCPEIYLISLV